MQMHCSMTSKQLQNMDTNNTACCMTPMLLAAKAAGCTPNTPHIFLLKLAMFVER
jgi:hypothetical protein